MTKQVTNLRKIADEVRKHFCVPYAQEIDDAADEIERLHKSIDTCGTEEGVCYGQELARKDAEIERLMRLLSVCYHRVQPSSMPPGDDEEVRSVLGHSLLPVEPEKP